VQRGASVAAAGASCRFGVGGHVGFTWMDGSVCCH
jgi:hypothetical protein